MKNYLLFLFVLTAVSCFGVTVADGGKSDYQIVIPDETADKALNDFVGLGGKVIQTAVVKATGAKLPLVRERKRIPDKPAIIIGNTRALKAAGYCTENFDLWEYGIAVKGSDIYLYGKDLPNPLKNCRYPGWFVYFTLGSLKAVCEFSEKFLNTRFIGNIRNSYGENEGVHTLPLKKIEVPDHFTLRKKPRFLVLSGDTGGLLFDVANNFLFYPSAEFGVHYHTLAIPQAKYFKTHPEYFAWRNGRRYFHAGDKDGVRPQYCLSNPDVQKLIYQNALDRADRGLKVVEFGQADGFRPCECERCKKWYNTSDWSEKLWLFHRDLAARLQKDRPGVTAAIACYEANHTLPKTFKRFPGKGVIIDVAPATPELMEGFKTFNILGMSAWTYVFGCYKASGYTPAYSFAHLQREMKFLHTTPISCFFHCGIHESMQIGGPWVYAWGKMQENPDLNMKKVLKEYCLYAFGKEAAPYWFKFFSLIDSRLEKYTLAPLKIEGGYDPAKGDDFTGPKPQNAVELWNQRYPKKIVDQLNALLAEALKRTDSGNFMGKTVKIEYEYLRLTAAVCQAIAAMDADNTYANRTALADALEARAKFIDSLPRRANKVQVEGKAFYGQYIAMLHRGGYMVGAFGGAFNCDPKILKSKVHSLEAVKVTGFDDSKWAKIPAETLRPMSPQMQKIHAEFKVAYTNKALLFQMTAPMTVKLHEKALKRDSFSMWENPVWEIFFATGSLMTQMVFNPLQNSQFDGVIYPKQKLRTQWNPMWSHEDIIENGIWKSRVTIPFAAFRGALKPGDLKQMQIGFSIPAMQTVYAWNPSITGAYADMSGFGNIRIGKRGPAERTIDINGDFTQTDAKVTVKNWYTYPQKDLMKKLGKSIALKAPVKNYLGLYSSVRIPMEPDEKAVITLYAHGKGKFNIGIGWANNAGRWVVNDGSPVFKLTPESRKYQVEFQLGRNIEKNADHFQVVIFCSKPEADLVLDSAEVKIIRKK